MRVSATGGGVWKGISHFPLRNAAEVLMLNTLKRDHMTLACDVEAEAGMR